MGKRSRRGNSAKIHSAIWCQRRPKFAEKLAVSLAYVDGKATNKR